MSAASPRVAFRRASVADVPAIVALLADDPLGAAREANVTPLPDDYYRAFAAIDADANQELVVAESAGAVVGVLQLTFLPSLTYQGRWRAQVEGVRVAPALRAGGVGRAMLQWSAERARARGCHLLQLTTDKERPEARRFYESLGFVASHDGMKLRL